MAVRLADFYKEHVKRKTPLWILAELIVTGLTFLLVLSLDIEPLTALFIVVLPSFVLHIGMYITLGKNTLRPLEIITRAVTFTSTQASDVQPPILTDEADDKSGLKSMVENIFARTAAPAVNTDNTKDDRELKIALLDTLDCGVIVLNEQREIVYANAAAPVHTDEKDQTTIQLLFEASDTLEQWLDYAESYNISAKHTWTRIANVLPEEPDRKIFDIMADYHKNGDKGIETVVLTVDRTEHYAVDEEDMDFIALAAHELRGPITVIRGYLEVLMDEMAEVIKPDQKVLFERLSVSALKLSSYINNILNVSRSDRRHLQLHLREDTLKGVYDSVAHDLALRASTQNRLLNVTFPDDLPTIAADRNSLSEVISNLIDNAIKYSNEGGTVTVTARLDGNSVRCDVQDFGMGIPSSVLSHLFTRFYRSHRSRKTVAGTGLGLYISKVIIESHGGQITASSTEGKGSTFTFSIPTYASVKDKLLANDSSNEGIIENSNGWIKNHSMIMKG